MADDNIRIIDVDGHVREADDLFEKYLEAPFRARAPKIEKVANDRLSANSGEGPPAAKQAQPIS